MNPAIAFINHVLTQQSWARARLKPYAGCRVRVRALPLDFKLTITPEGLVAAGLQASIGENGSHQGSQGGSQGNSQGGSQGRAQDEAPDGPPGEARVGPHADSPADVTLSLPLSSTPLFAFDPERAMKQVRIEGDAEFAQTLSQLARELRWDAEEDLSRFTGDIAAHQLMQGARSFQAYARDASQRIAETGTAYLIDEDAALVRKSMAEQFARDVSALRDDAARLEKRLELQETRRRR